MKNLSMRVSISIILFIASAISISILPYYIHPDFGVQIFVLVLPIIGYLGLSSSLILDLYNEMTYQKEMNEISEKYSAKLEEINSRSEELDEILEIMLMQAMKDNAVTEER